MCRLCRNGKIRKDLSEEGEGLYREWFRGDGWKSSEAKQNGRGCDSGFRGVGCLCVLWGFFKYFFLFSLKADHSAVYNFFFLPESLMTWFHSAASLVCLLVPSLHRAISL